MSSKNNSSQAMETLFDGRHRHQRVRLAVAKMEILVLEKDSDKLTRTQASRTLPSMMSALFAPMGSGADMEWAHQEATNTASEDE